VKSGGSLTYNATAEGKSAYELDNYAITGIPKASRSQAHTAHTNQRTRPTNLHQRDQSFDNVNASEGGKPGETGAAGKRQPTTYIISNEGEIGVRRRIESPKS
jgi:hypothetical protein